jgi:5'-nucleotidase/UDP-sugar diphosphatase
MSIPSFSPMTFATRPMPLPMMPAAQAPPPRRGSDSFTSSGLNARPGMSFAANPAFQKPQSSYQPPISAFRQNGANVALAAMLPYLSAAAMSLANSQKPPPQSLSNATPPQSATIAQPLLPVPPQPPGMSALRVIYNNDEHEKPQVKPHLISGFHFFSRQAEMAGRPVMRLNAGDNNVGKEADEWKLTVLLMNRIGYHGVTMGNHELDPGSRGYADGLALANFPTLLSNLKVPATSPLAQKFQEGKLRKDPQILQLGQERIGMIGVTTPHLKDVLSSQAKLQGEAVEDWEHTVALVRQQVEALQRQGVNKIVLLSHLGKDDSQKLAQTVAGIDIIEDGHSHDELPGVVPGENYVKSPTGEPVLILQAGKNSQKMGVADVLFDPQGRVIPQQNQLYNPKMFPADPQAVAMRDAVLGVPKPIAMFITRYDASGNDYRPDALGQFTADAMRRNVPDVDVAFVRSPEIRSNFEPGQFTDQDLKALMPFSDPIIKMTASGEEILKSLQKSAQGIVTKTPHPGMLNTSGLAATMNKQTGDVSGVRVFNRQAGQWGTLDPSKIYKIAIGEFTVKNKEFPDLAHPERITWNSDRPARDFFNLGLQQIGAPQRPVAFNTDSRLQIV